jgi:hypothetical protein
MANILNIHSLKLSTMLLLEFSNSVKDNNISLHLMQELSNLCHLSKEKEKTVEESLSRLVALTQLFALPNWPDLQENSSFPSISIKLLEMWK